MSSDILVNETVNLGEGGEFVLPEDLGRIGVDVEWNKIAPFIWAWKSSSQ